MQRIQCSTHKYAMHALSIWTLNNSHVLCRKQEFPTLQCHKTANSGITSFGIILHYDQCCGQVIRNTIILTGDSFCVFYLHMMINLWLWLSKIPVATAFLDFLILSFSSSLLRGVESCLNEISGSESGVPRALDPRLVPVPSTSVFAALPGVNNNLWSSVTVLEPAIFTCLVLGGWAIEANEYKTSLSSLLLSQESVCSTLRLLEFVSSLCVAAAAVVLDLDCGDKFLAVRFTARAFFALTSRVCGGEDRLDALRAVVEDLGLGLEDDALVSEPGEEDGESFESLLALAVFFTTGMLGLAAWDGGALCLVTVLLNLALTAVGFPFRWVCVCAQRLDLVEMLPVPLAFLLRLGVLCTCRLFMFETFCSVFVLRWTAFLAISVTFIGTVLCLFMTASLLGRASLLAGVLEATSALVDFGLDSKDPALIISFAEVFLGPFLGWLVGALEPPFLNAAGPLTGPLRVFSLSVLVWWAPTKNRLIRCFARGSSAYCFQVSSSLVHPFHRTRYSTLPLCLRLAMMLSAWSRKMVSSSWVQYA